MVQLSRKLTLKSTEETIKLATDEKKDENVLHDIRDVDLLAKEFQVHDKCRLDYTRKRDNDEPERSEKTAFGQFDVVTDFIQDHVLQSNQAASMTLIHELYADGHSGDSRNCSKLKQKIVDYFPDQLHLLTIDEKSVQVVVSKEGIYSKIIIGSKETILKEAAKCLQHDVISFENSLSEMPWPPPIEYFENRNQELPPNLTNFVQMVLKSSNCPISEKVNHMKLSLSQDLVHGITQGRVMTLKHFIRTMSA